MAGTTSFLCLILFSAVAALPKDFHGYELLSVFVKDNSDLNTLLQLREKYPNLDFWKHPASQTNATVLVTPEIINGFKSDLRTHNIPTFILSDDVQSIVDASNKRTPKEEVESLRQASGYVLDHYNYHSYSEILDSIQQLASTYPGLIKIFYLNRQTFEGRSVLAVKLSSTNGSNKPVIIIEAGAHAREWISPASTLFFIDKLLRNYRAGVSTATFMLNKYDLYIVPVTNPDGYTYSQTKDRLWRKNRRYISKGCYGVDLNRNFDIQFGITGVSPFCNGDEYPGPYAFSEAETLNIRDLFNSLIQNVVAYVSVHSFGQFLLVPWGYSKTSARPSNSVELDRVTKLMARAIASHSGKIYKQGTPMQTIGYAASGSSDDWALFRKKNIYSFTIELRPNSGYSYEGFMLPASEIIPTGEDFWASILTLAQQMKV